MPWILEDEEPEIEEETSIPQTSEQEDNLTGGWVVDESEEEEEPSTSPLRAAAAPFRGAALGTGIFGSLQDAFAVGEMPTAEKPLPGQTAKWTRESEILGRMQDPNYKPTALDFAMLESDNEIPEDLKAYSKEEVAGYIDSATGGKLIPQTGLERILTKVPEVATEFALLGTGGRYTRAPGEELKLALKEGSLLTRAGKEAITGGLFGLGSQIAEEGGASPVGQFLTGVATSGAPAIYQAGKTAFEKSVDLFKNVKDIFSKKGLPEGTPKFLEEVGTKKALADLELSSKDLAGRTAQISDEMLASFEKQHGKGSWEKLTDVPQFNSAEIEKDLLKSNEESVLNTVAPKPTTHKEGWESIKSVVEASAEDARKANKILYDEVETLAKGVQIEPTETFKAAKELAKETRATLFRAPEEAGLKNASEVLVHKLVKPQGKLAKTLIEDLKKEGIFADYEEVLSFLKKDAMEDAPRKIRGDRALATKRSVSRILDKSGIIPAPVDLLRSISKALKKDIYKGFEKVPGLSDKFHSAEEMYGMRQDLFNNEAILKLRKTENPEAMTHYFSTSSNKEKLNNVLSANKQMADLSDRMILENAATKGKEAAQQFTRELSPYLGPEARSALDTLNEYGDKLTSKGQQSIIRGNALADMERAFEEGTRPEYTLKLMQNKNGYNIVKNALDTSPKGRAVFKTLQRQTVSDLLGSVTNESGHIDFEKTKDLLKNPFTKTILEDTIGKEGLQFFEKLEGYGKNFQKNLSMLERQEPGFIRKIADKFLNNYSAGLFTIIFPWAHAWGGAGLGAIAVKEGIIAGKEAYKRAQLFKLLEEPQVISSLKSISQPNVSKKTFEEGVKRISQFASKYEMQDKEEESE